MSNYGYGGGQNPFDERNAADSGGYGGYNQGGYSQGGYNQGGYGQGGYDQGSSMEMSGGGNISFLNECRNIDSEIKRVDENLTILRELDRKASQEADRSVDSRTNQEITQLMLETSNRYTDLGQRLRTLGSNPESRSPRCKPHFDRVKRSLMTSRDDFLKVRVLIEDKSKELERQYKVAHADATDEDIKNLVQDANKNTPVFAQAVMQNTRTGLARKNLQSLRDRSNALQAIEQQMAQLFELFEQLDTIVVQQDTTVAQIEQKAEETVENLDKGNEEIGVAVETARKTRKKKWICLGIIVLIIVILAVALAIYFTSHNSNSKRSLSDQLQEASTRLVPRVVGESNIKKWVETTQRRGMVPTGMSTGDGHLSGGAFDLSKRVAGRGHDLPRAFA